MALRTSSGEWVLSQRPIIDPGSFTPRDARNGFPAFHTAEEVTETSIVCAESEAPASPTGIVFICLPCSFVGWDWVDAWLVLGLEELA